MNSKLRERYVKYIAEFFNDFGISYYFLSSDQFYIDPSNKINWIVVVPGGASNVKKNRRLQVVEESDL